MNKIDKKTILHNEELQERYYQIRRLLKEVSDLLGQTVVGFKFTESSTTITYLAQDETN